jgi:hypothetical protein
MYTAWSGSATLEYPIQRAFHEPSGQYYFEDDPQVPEEESNGWKFVELVLYIAGEGYYTPAKLYGPLELCYTEESNLDWRAECSAWKNILSKDETADVLSASEIEDINTRLVELIKEDQ